MICAPCTHAGYKLLHEGTLALSDVEANGIKIDVPYLKKAIADTENRVRSIETKLREWGKEDPKTHVWGLWRKRFGQDANLDSAEQLGEVLFNVMKFPCKNRTPSGLPSTDESDLEKVDLPFIKGYLRRKKLDKALTTNLRGIERELDADGFLHPVFNLNTVETFRSSSEKPNFQNFPVRDMELAKLVRSSFVSRFGKKGVLVENDYKGVEVSVSACYHKDQNFISYIIDPKKDMHRDMAAQLFCFTEEEWKLMAKKFPKAAKDARYGAKNMFVFPQFYGDYYLHCAQNLWEWAQRAKLVGPNGEPMIEWLASKGITGLGACDKEQDAVPGTFEHHVKTVEQDFWNNRFRAYGRWKKQWYDKYLNLGYFDTYTGFRIAGVFNRKQVINYPVQGSAFHCLLWSLVRINRELQRRGMRSRVAGQIHDSIIGDVHVDELEEYLTIVKHYSTVAIRKAFPWLNVPLVVENEICAPGASWFYKKEFGFDDGVFSFKDGDNKRSFTTSAEFLEFITQQHEQSIAA